MSGITFGPVTRSIIEGSRDPWESELVSYDCERCGAPISIGSDCVCPVRTSLDVAPFSDDPYAEICRHCGKRADWHDAADGQCPDDDAPHPYSVAADAMSGAECEHGPRGVKTCGGCDNSWCEDCDPSPAALCHYCHGRGYSTAPRVAVVR